MKTDDLFFQHSYLTKDHAYQAWVTNGGARGLNKEFLAKANKIVPGDNNLLILAGKTKIYLLRFHKELFLWQDPSVFVIDGETIKGVRDNRQAYSISYNCVATAIINNPNIHKVIIGEQYAEMLPLSSYFKQAKNMKLWYLNLAPNALDCQGPSGKTYSFYNQAGENITKYDDY